MADGLVDLRDIRIASLVEEKYAGRMLDYCFWVDDPAADFFISGFELFSFF